MVVRPCDRGEVDLCDPFLVVLSVVPLVPYPGVVVLDLTYQAHQGPFLEVAVHFHQGIFPSSLEVLVV